MNGSRQGELAISFMRPVLFSVAAVSGLIGLLSTPPLSTFCFVLFAAAITPAIYLWAAMKAKESSQTRREEEDRQRFAEAYPQLYLALLELERLCNLVPGIKVIRFNTSSVKSVEDCDIQICACAIMGENQKPVKVVDMPVDEWKASFPESIGGYKVGIRFVASPVSLGWVGGISTGIWHVRTDAG